MTDLTINYDNHKTSKKYEDAEQFDLCICPICERTGKKVTKLTEPATGLQESVVVHKEIKKNSWENDKIDVCSPAF